MVSLPADQTIVLGHSRSCDASHTKDGTTPAPLPAALVETQQGQVQGIGLCEARNAAAGAMRDANQLRKEARQLLLEANEGERQGQSEHTDRLKARSQQCSDDAAVLEAAETRLNAERLDHERKVLRSARILPFRKPRRET